MITASDSLNISFDLLHHDKLVISSWLQGVVTRSLPTRSLQPFLPRPCLHSNKSRDNHFESMIWYDCLYYDKSHLPSPMSHLSSPTSHLPPSTSYLPSPTSHLPCPTSHLPAPTSHLLSPISHLLPPMSHLPSPTSYLPSPNSYLPSPTSHLPPPTSHLPPPTSHLPCPNSHFSSATFPAVLRTYSFQWTEFVVT